LTSQDTGGVTGRMTDLADSIKARLEAVDRPTDFTFAQGAWLASRAAGMELAIDLGTGLGNSASILSLVCPEVHTFDLEPRWKDAAAKLAAIGASVANVEAHVGDLAAFDFAPLLSRARSVFLFWDAHGFDIAETVLGRIMPLIADKPHLVACHDISDVRFAGDDAYQSKRLWRGMTAYYENPGEFAYAHLGWFCAIVDQIIPILDFCSRNKMELRSVDFEFRQRPNAALSALLPSMAQHFDMAYFSMNETDKRFFPRPPIG
jgi:hypothetical protein